MAGVGDEDVAGVGGEGVGVSGQVLAEGVEALALVADMVSAG